MRNKLILVLGMAAALAAGCAKSPKEGPNDAEIRYFESWVIAQKAKHPEYLWKETPLGSFILEDTPGNGTLIGDAEATPFVFLRYTVSDLNGNIISSSEEDVAKQIGTYKYVNYYGPRTFYRKTDGLSGCLAGEDEIFTGMRVGGSRKVVVPGWLLTSSRYDTKAEYMAKKAQESAIYDITVLDSTTDMGKWQADSIEAYLRRVHPDASLDTTGKYGFYYYQITPPPADAAEIGESEKVYLNYTGFLLNGHIFDSTDEYICKDNHLSKTSYGPVYVNWKKAEEYSSITMGDDASNLVDGFTYALSKMKRGEKGLAVFYSVWGYGINGNEPIIPALSPIAFEIELLQKGEEE
ncbi:MAG: FKBP-type peptidyl-prolyl cis-trans isomerase [Bacteroidales bacterium]|nr:FKBP-type peptidyl-prolyl cis-trans isomerase [Bacteroidales bacterium]